MPASCYEVLVCSTGGSGDVNIDANNDQVVYHGFKSRASLTWKPIDHDAGLRDVEPGLPPGRLQPRRPS